MKVFFNQVKSMFNKTWSSVRTPFRSYLLTLDNWPLSLPLYSLSIHLVPYPLVFFFQDILLRVFLLLLLLSQTKVKSTLSPRHRNTVKNCILLPSVRCWWGFSILSPLVSCVSVQVLHQQFSLHFIDPHLNYPPCVSEISKIIFGSRGLWLYLWEVSREGSSIM